MKENEPVMHDAKSLCKAFVAGGKCLLVAGMNYYAFYQRNLTAQCYFRAAKCTSFMLAVYKVSFFIAYLISRFAS